MRARGLLTSPAAVLLVVLREKLACITETLWAAAEGMATDPGVRCILRPVPSVAAKPRFHSCRVGIVQYIALDALMRYEGTFVSQFGGLGNEVGGKSFRLFCCPQGEDREVSV